ncbi:Hemopexin [Channa argus]|uniref:Hemopexin n=1 Tax=Channa argus TaxID=215402 RepID=A0A6G1PX90_CHAAH|nr:Hemopexin [Channa argus]
MLAAAAAGRIPLSRLSWARGHLTMKLLTHILYLSLALSLSWADHHEHGHAPGSPRHKDHAHGHGHGHRQGHAHAQGHGHAHGHDHGHAAALPDRCKGIEMDGAVVTEEGVPYFFKGDHLFKGFHGQAELSNASFAELDDHHHLGHVDAAFRMHFEDSPNEHDRIFFFLDNKVFSFYKHKLEEGYPKDISQAFPGIPDHLDAAVECPKPECDEYSVIFFKGNEIFHYNVRTKAVERKEFTSMPNCTSVFRNKEQYLCFYGRMFSKFDPKTGEVYGKYPKEYFMKCSDDSDHVQRERCSHVHLDAITSDDAGNIYAFRGHHFLRKDAGNDTLRADTIEEEFKELHNEADAVFSYEGHLHMIKDNQVFVYKTGEPHTHLEGYPKSVKEELGIDGPIDAAFVCQDHHIAHIIKGHDIYDVELKTTPRVATNKRPIALFKKIDAAMCGPGGVKVFVGNHFYNFESTMILVVGRALPVQHTITRDLFGYDH